MSQLIEKGSPPQMKNDGADIIDILGDNSVRYVPDQDGPGPNSPDDSAAAAAAEKEQGAEKAKEGGADFADQPVTYEQMPEDQASSDAEQAGYEGAYHMRGEQQSQIGGETQGQDRAKTLGHELGEHAGGEMQGLDESTLKNQLPAMEGVENGLDRPEWENEVRADCAAANQEFQESGEQEAGQEAGSEQEDDAAADDAQMEAGA